MTMIRIDENSTTNRLREVINMKVGEVFSVSPDFLSQFIKEIPTNRIFKFKPIEKTSPKYTKYGENCYEVTFNREVVDI